MSELKGFGAMGGKEEVWEARCARCGDRFQDHGRVGRHVFELMTYSVAAGIASGDFSAVSIFPRSVAQRRSLLKAAAIVLGARA